jgi:hypothetical protein
VSAATQVYYASFDTVFVELPVALRVRIETKFDEIGSPLAPRPPGCVDCPLFIHAGDTF